MTGDVPFEFAVVAEPDCGLDEWVTTVRSVEDLGYDALLVTDHLRLRLAAIPALAMAAGITTRIRLGSYVLNADLRNPALLAAEVATLHTLSGGRAIAGLGAGWMRDDYERAGVDLSSGASRLDRLRAAVTRTRETLASATADGATPAPLLLGGGRRRALELAGREADIVSMLPPLGLDGPIGYDGMLEESLGKQVAWVRAGAAGRDVRPRLNHLLWGCFVTSNPDAVTAALAKRWNCPRAVVPRLFPYLIGSAGQIAQQLHARRERWGFSFVAVPVRMAKAFVLVMQALRR
ncbi:LLM class flavin-dependent oxidoreductase [Streptomyces ipomoeae]|uniref:LLM class flavin-dependent oxidoreductase n=1 Tax=Streptomyces ipomoeae TaxID=103232 RepID=UPI0015F01863|nr:LLM class flavin-dependent oxidoreductase [Streptomyces ipomoeae]MDX2939122.1 LLM class flavin-dependent oxidoreductase [Streptomyces ipomoeae]